MLLLLNCSLIIQLIAKHPVLPHLNIKSTGHAAHSRGSAIGCTVTTANFSDGYPCPAAAGKIHFECFNGDGLVQMRGAQLPSAQFPVKSLKHRKAPVTRFRHPPQRVLPQAFAYERQSRLGAEVAGQFLDNKVRHVEAHLVGKHIS